MGSGALAPYDLIQSYQLNAEEEKRYRQHYKQLKRKGIDIAHLSAYEGQTLIILL
jgi:hypothetical protein